MILEVIVPNKPKFIVALFWLAILFGYPREHALGQSRVDYDIDNQDVNLATSTARAPIPPLVARLRLGVGGSGTLNMSGGSIIASTTINRLVVASEVGSIGNLSVAGLGTMLATGTGINIGNIGKGTAEVSDGAILASRNIVVARSGGAGTLNIFSNGKVTAAGGVAMSVFGGSTGLISVSSGGTMAITGTYVPKMGGGLYAPVELTESAGPDGTVPGWLLLGTVGNAAALKISSGGSVSTPAMAVSLSDQGINNVSVEGPGSMINVTNDAIVGFGGAAELVVSDQALLKTKNLYLGASGIPDSRGLLIIGAYATDGNATEFSVPTTAGTVEANLITINANSVIYFNHTNGDYVFASPLTSAVGEGSIVNVAGTTRLTAAEGFGGAIEVKGGRLFLENAPNASTVVSSGALLGGNAGVGSLLVEGQGRLSPGNSIGTVTVTGNASFASGAIYEVEVDSAGNVDLLNVGGTLTLASGSVLAIRPLDAALAGVLVPGLNETVIATAAGGVSGTFSTVQDNFAFLDPIVRYDAQNIYLTLARNDFAYTTLTQTATQRNVAEAIAGMPGSDPVFEAVQGVTRDEAPSAFNQLSAAAYGSLRNVLLATGDDVTSGIVGRFMADDWRTRGGLDYWSSVSGGARRAEGSAFADTASQSGGIAAFGLEASSSNAMIGFAVGGGRTDFSIEHGHLRGSSDDAYLSLYGQYASDALIWSAAVTGARHYVDAKRQVSFSTLNETLTSKFDATAINAYSELSGSFEAGEGFTLRPYAGISANLISGAFAERGGSASLSGDLDDQLVLKSVVGLRLRQSCSQLQAFSPCFDLGAAWAHRFDNEASQTTARFGQSQSFSSFGGAADPNALSLDVGARMALSSTINAHLSYNFERASSMSAHAVKLEIGGKF